MAKPITYISAIFIVAISAVLFKTGYLSRVMYETLYAPQTTEVSVQTKSETARVASVIDGDTIVLSNGKRVRYIGIDTPELARDGNPAECYSEEAKKENASLIEGKEIRLVRDISDTDQYGRLLRYVYQGDIFVNRELVSGGFARHRSYPPDTKKNSELRNAELQAKRDAKGIWSSCPSNQ